MADFLFPLQEHSLGTRSQKFVWEKEVRKKTSLFISKIAEIERKREREKGSGKKTVVMLFSLNFQRFFA